MNIQIHVLLLGLGINYIYRPQLYNHFLECNCGIGGKGCNNQTGKCICKEGYTGPKCERIKYKLRVMRVKMGANGMNGGVFGITAFGGGEYSFKICQEENNECCETDQFGTEDNNWEKHEVNYFVGKQLLSCENFVIEAGKKLTIKAQHTGGDGSIIQNITLYGSKYRANTYHTCSIGRKLDHDQSHNSTCLEHPPAYVYEDSCNGDASFCVLPFNEVTFAGAHNAGTGMVDRYILFRHKSLCGLCFLAPDPLIYRFYYNCCDLTNKYIIYLQVWMRTMMPLIVLLKIMTYLWKKCWILVLDILILMLSFVVITFCTPVMEKIICTLDLAK